MKFFLPPVKLCHLHIRGFARTATICAFDRHQGWVTLTCYKFEFSENLADLGGNNSDSVVTH